MKDKNNCVVILSTVNGEIIAIKQVIVVAIYDVDNHILILYLLTYSMEQSPS